MLTFIVVLHIIVAVLLITMVLLQDSKGGAMGGMMGGASSNSLFGSTGATTFLAKLTRALGIIFAVTCVTLTIMAGKQEKSVIDGYTAPAANAPAIPAVPANEGMPTPTPATETPATK
jgi:preprotein translocase subunit SecG